MVNCYAPHFYSFINAFLHFVSLDVIRYYHIAQRYPVSFTNPAGYAGQDDEFWAKFLREIKNELSTWRIPTVQRLGKKHIEFGLAQAVPKQVRSFVNNLIEPSKGPNCVEFLLYDRHDYRERPPVSSRQPHRAERSPQQSAPADFIRIMTGMGETATDRFVHYLFSASFCQDIP